MTIRSLALAGCIASTIAACSGQTEDASDAGSTPSPDSGKVTSPSGGDDGSLPPSDDGAVPPATDGGKVSKPKAIGSPCSVDSDCDSSLTCNLTFPGGLCTKTCAADTECTGKQGSVGACLNTLCFAACAVAPDAGGDDAAVAGDAGKPKSPCKNKAFLCRSVAGETQQICVPPTGSDASTGDDGSAADAASE